MSKHYRAGWISLLIIFCSLAFLVPATAFAYSQYSQNGDDTNCAGCHGDFRSKNYYSPVDGQLWGNIHNLHRQTMLNGDCSTCHSPSGPRTTSRAIQVSPTVGARGCVSIIRMPV